MNKQQGQENHKSKGSEQNTQDKLTVKSVWECRICLQVNSPQNAKMLSPCKCTGSLKFVHDDCLREWIYKIVNKSSQKISSGKAHICCEICKEKICFKTSKTLKCKTKEQIAGHFKQNIKTFVLLLLLLITNLGFFSALLNYFLFVGFKTLITNNVVLVSLIISGQVIFSIVTIVTFACIINKYFFSKKFVVFQLQDREQKQFTKNWSTQKSKKGISTSKLQENLNQTFDKNQLCIK